MREVPHDAVLRAGLVEAVAPGEDERAWLDCDLASLAENRLDERADPLALAPARRAAWLARATVDGEHALAARPHEAAYWLLEGGARVGTIALSRSTFGLRDAKVSSLYVLPSHRGRGVGRRCLARLGEALGREGLGFRLDTCWGWGRTVRFYLRAGLWVLHWKRDLCFGWSPGLAPPRIDVGAGEVSVSVARRDGRIVTLARARDEGETFAIELSPRELAGDPEVGAARWLAGSTLALALALEGRALVRSEALAAEEGSADAGPPEALARQIPIWEAWDRAQGWRVDQPRIPGLAYPTWEALEAGWRRGA